MSRRGQSWAGARACAAGVAALITVSVSLVATTPAGATNKPSSSAASVRLSTIGPAATVPRDSVVGRLSSSASVQAELILEPRNATALSQYAQQVSSPGAASYRHYISPAKFRAEFAPTAAEAAMVASELRRLGLKVGPTAADGLAIPISATASQIDAAFHTVLDSVKLAGGHMGRWASLTPRLPNSVAQDTMAVIGLDELAVPTPLGIAGTAPAAPTSWAPAAPAAPAATPATSSTSPAPATPATPATSNGGPTACSAATKTARQLNSYTDTQFASAYGLDGLYSDGDLGAGQTVGLFELDTFAMSDLAAFERCYFGASHTNQVSLINIDGGEPPGPGGGEAALDVEDVAAYAPAAHIDVYDAPGTLTGWAAEMLAIVGQDKASVVNVSYGLCEADMQSASPGFAQTENVLLEEAALQGQTFVVASGDAGSETCYRNDGTTGLSVSDPASQPYALSVGGTSMLAATNPPVETVWNDGGSSALGDSGAGGGGISDTWPMPAWQASSSVPGIRSKYSSGAPCGAPVHTDCREVPDVSASADELHGDTIVYGDYWTTIGGTSAAAPKWTAILAETNSYCATQHLASVGFAAPPLYQIASNPAEYAEAFNDITKGNNDVLGLHDGAYPATKGYDMASGLGSPRVTGENGTTGLTALLCAAGGVAKHPSVSGLSPNFGSYAGGTPVTITGTDLGGATRVQFGPASVVVTASDINGNGTSIVVDSPKSPTQPFNGSVPVGGVVVSVSGPDGTSNATLSAEFHYVAGSDGSPLPSVDFVSPSSAPAGKVITVYGSGFEDGLGTAKAPSVRIGGVASSAVVVVSDTELRVRVPVESSSTDCATKARGVSLSNICQTEVTVSNSYGTSATQRILPPPTGVVSEIFLAIPGEEVVPAVTEFDYAPTPVITSIDPSTIGLYENFPDPDTTTELQVNGTGYDYFTLQSVDLAVPGDSSLDQALTFYEIMPTEITCFPPVLLPGGESTSDAPRATSAPTSATVTVVAGGSTSKSKTISIAPDNMAVQSISDHDGPVSGGTVVKVTGKNLASATAALFAGEQELGGYASTSNVKVVSSTQVDVSTPAFPAEEGVLSLCNATECVGTARTSSFAYYEPVQPVVTGISRSSGSAGGGQEVTISGSGLGSVTAVKFGSTIDTRVGNPQTFLGANTTAVIATTPAGKIGDKVAVTVVTLAGTSKPAAVFFTYEKGVPGPPTALAVTTGLHGSVVTWKAPPNGGSPIVGYRVFAHSYVPYQRSPVTYVPSVVVRASARTATLALPPGVYWRIQVAATTALGSAAATYARGVFPSFGDDGYAVATSYGGIIGYGDLATLPTGSSGTKLSSPAVGYALDGARTGSWVVEADGTVLGYGTPSLGSLTSSQHASPAAVILSDPVGSGYWIITAAGGVFSYGAAAVHGSMSKPPSAPIVAAAATADGGGYWMTSGTGTVYAFGDAAKAGSWKGKLAGTVVAVVSAAASTSGSGYWLVSSTGQIEAVDGAPPLKPVSSAPTSAVVGASAVISGSGLWMLEADGAVLAIGAAAYEGAPGSSVLGAPVAIGS
ncbi:MAG: IPT/TIG domain-containing protein [Acidimicrobiales bacterium]